MDIDYVQNLLNPKTTTETTRKKDISGLTSDDFMTLMLKQLQSQDPLKPTDNTQFIAQMAQLTSVSGISEMNESMTDMIDTLRGSQMLSAASLVGREVLVESNTIAIDASSPDLVGEIELSAKATSVDIEIKNAAGVTVRRLHAADQAAGPLVFGWDGTDENGSKVADGQYSISATATISGKTEALTTLVRAPVTGVTMSGTGGAAQLQLQGLGSKSLSDIKEVG